MLQAQQIGYQIRALRQFSLPLPGMLLQARKLWAQMMSQITTIFTSVPGQPETRQIRQGGALPWRGRSALRAVDVQKGPQLRQMRLLLLPIDMPQQRPCRPLRPHKGVLSPDQVEIAGSQQPVVLILR